MCWSSSRVLPAVQFVELNEAGLPKGAPSTAISELHRKGNL